MARQGGAYERLDEGDHPAGRSPPTERPAPGSAAAGGLSPRRHGQGTPRGTAVPASSHAAASGHVVTTDEDGPPVAAIAPPARGVPIAAVADRAPAGAVPTAVAMPVGQRTYNGMPPALFHVPDLPDAVQAWNGLRPMMALWMAFSVGMVVLSPAIIFIGLPLGILGIVAASLHLFEACRGRSSIVGSVVTIKVLAAVIASLEFVLAGILLLVLIGAAENGAVGYIAFLILVYSSHAALSLAVFKKMQYIGNLLNPVQSGLVVL